MKNTDGQAIANVLSKVAQEIRRLDESEVETLLAGDFQIELVIGRARSRHKKNSKPLATDSQQDLSDVAHLLANLVNREQGRALLEQRVPTRDVLTQLARHLDLPLQKRETVERLKEKIIEATIGYRLRSRAIRGTEDIPIDSPDDRFQVTTTEAEK